MLTEEETLQCGFCQRVFEDPVRLNCGHSLCLSCASESAVEHTLKALKRKLASIDPEAEIDPKMARGVPCAKVLVTPCSVCGSSTLLKDVVRNKVLEEKVVERAKQKCGFCDEDAFVLCESCGLFCSKHFECIHASNDAVAAHRWFPLVPKPNKKAVPFCKHHLKRADEESFQLKYYCSVCNVPVCAVCVLEGKHVGHSVVKISKHCKTIRYLSVDESYAEPRCVCDVNPFVTELNQKNAREALPVLSSLEHALPYKEIRDEFYHELLLEKLAKSSETPADIYSQLGENFNTLLRQGGGVDGFDPSFIVELLMEGMQKYPHYGSDFYGSMDLLDADNPDVYSVDEDEDYDSSDDASLMSLEEYPFVDITLLQRSQSYPSPFPTRDEKCSWKGGAVFDYSHNAIWAPAQDEAHVSAMRVTSLNSKGEHVEVMYTEPFPLHFEECHPLLVRNNIYLTGRNFSGEKVMGNVFGRIMLNQMQYQTLPPMPGGDFCYKSNIFPVGMNIFALRDDMQMMSFNLTENRWFELPYKMRGPARLSGDPSDPDAFLALYEGGVFERVRAGTGRAIATFQALPQFTLSLCTEFKVFHDLMSRDQFIVIAHSKEMHWKFFSSRTNTWGDLQWEPLEQGSSHFCFNQECNMFYYRSKDNDYWNYVQLSDY